MLRDQLPNTSLDSTIVSIASRGMGGGTATTIFGWFMSNEVLAFTGILITILGFILNFVFQRRRDRREAELHKVQLAAFRKSSDE